MFVDHCLTTLRLTIMLAINEASGQEHDRCGRSLSVSYRLF
jgi:hypothetical protein